MSDALSRNVTRLREIVTRLRTPPATSPAITGGGGALGGATFADGVRVFDTVTGQEGTVVATRKRNIVHPPPER